MVIISLVYLAVALAALAFYGACILRVVLPDKRRDTGLAMAFGLAGYTAFCGLLEVTQTASRPLLLIVGLIGAVGYAVSWVREPPALNLASWSQAPLTARLGFLLFVMLFALFLLNAADWHYAYTDDLQGYLVFPERILSEGSLGRDPFNYRRIESGLTGGGGYFYALFRAGLPLRETRLADVGVGSVCLLLLVAGHTREQQASSGQVAAMLLVALAAIVFSPITNMTPEVLAKALLFALLRLAYVLQARPPSTRRAAALALSAFALVALKTSCLPGAAAVLAAFYISLLGRQPLIKLAAEATATAAAMVLLMFPWMVACYAAAGTAWFPLLGTGTLSAEEVTGIVALYPFVHDAGRLTLILIPAALIALSAWSSNQLRDRRVFLAALVILSFIAMIAAQLKYTAFGYRYGHAVIVPLVLFYLPIGLRCLPRYPWRLGLAASLAVALVVVAMTKIVDRRWIDDGWIGERVAGPLRPGASDWRVGRASQLQAMQDAVPRGEPLLVLLSWPSLLDFRRNPIAVMDHPAMIGPPVVPAADDPAAWARYLIAHGFRYVAYSYGDEASYSRVHAQRDIAKYSGPLWYSRYMVVDDTAELQMRDTMLALRQYGTVIYDDGSQFVIRLEGG